MEKILIIFVLIIAVGFAAGFYQMTYQTTTTDMHDMQMPGMQTHGEMPSASKNEPSNIDHMNVAVNSPKAASVGDISRRTDDIPLPITRDYSKRVVFELRTKEVVAEIAPGITYEYWTYDGTVPGPFLRVREGDTVEIHLTHDAHSQTGKADGMDSMAFSLVPAVLAHGDEEMPIMDAHSMDGTGGTMSGDEHAIAGHAAHSIDLHAVIGPGGGGTITQSKTGETKVFQFIASRSGLYIYHCASPDIPTHIANGMYGMILVEPKEGLKKVDKEFYVMQGELYTEGSLNEPGLQHFSKEKVLAGRPEYVVFNGRVGALTGGNALRAKTGEKIRLFLGVGTFIPSNFHVIGGIFDALYPEGDIVSSPRRNIQTTIIPAGGSAMAELTFGVPGKYLLVDHNLPNALYRGALGELIVSGLENPERFSPINP
ncbi:MAG: hypothetical protein A3A28_03685 [Candidatus Sungbacteria bacterium RIFCSPLOWO2_01_FULL_47_32]|uniref:Uncharacterized protein n=1 Tax=Candidatus Sungbacteria bacterium RIFCSPHIGHO2_01_FULL_47_32 TaxID=1802264 RepID=A0A1G2K269_9BACT|nr:MAG: Nitrite reductase, copper-containing [Parcubacteria group bacterium GW2011_GWA2_47_10]OGZ93497.1 MAG: hypothetical protein A2633_06435 [Candidatus Sungbacteria bacterium RIFCSPHIGHO2_01_FULL_47_32]OGZ97952.1 MAG: hypothetical protein A3D57_05005 [Candidatus Sungbacteria bacterium RIFCSPHIGHO2_02_FULL_46_12]OHA04396.1 MAG: hypothetical protein A3A28_03685 [Candidatus Sungbacteria bacterium RIFCSPLOWO2_01_FULL_47_32]